MTSHVIKEKALQIAHVNHHAKHGRDHGGFGH